MTRITGVATAVETKLSLNYPSRRSNARIMRWKNTYFPQLLCTFMYIDFEQFNGS